MNATNFSPTFFEVLKLVRDSENLDPILRTIILKKVLEAGDSASQPMAASFCKRMLPVLDEDTINTKVNWIAPEGNGVAQPEREKATRILSDQFGLWSFYVDEMKKTYADGIAIPIQPFQWVGWIAKENSQCVLHLKNIDSKSTLFVIKHSGRSSQIIPVTVSEIQEAGTPITLPLEVQIAGLPVYAIASLPAALAKKN
jgi:hypothetical protein